MVTKRKRNHRCSDMQISWQTCFFFQLTFFLLSYTFNLILLSYEELLNKRPVGLSSFVNCPPVVASFLTQRQLSINAGWQHMGRVPHPNYVYPECCVATVCHQVRFMYWEHLGHFQRAISHLKWHKIVCMRYLACAFSQMKSTDMFSMYLQSGVPRHFIWWFIAGWT